MSGNDEKPLDMQRNWFNIARRLQSVCSQSDGVKVLSIKIIIVDGKPEFWTIPEYEKTEPEMKGKEMIRYLRGGV